MRQFRDLLFVTPAVVMLAFFAKAAGFGALPLFALPLWGVYLLGRVHGMRLVTEALAKERQKQGK